MRTTSLFIPFFAFLVFISWHLTSCSEDENPPHQDPKNNTNLPDHHKQIITFYFQASSNDALTADVSTEIYETEKMIYARVPFRTDISALTPEVTLSPLASSNLQGPQDFRMPVNYTITAEDGSSVDYTVIVVIDEIPALIALYEANPDLNVNWDFNDSDLSHWEHVVINSIGQIESLELYGLSVFSPELTDLPQIESLTLRGALNVSDLPAEIGRMTSLTQLKIVGSGLSTLPEEIGALTNLEELVITDSQLETIPEEIGNLVNLVQIDLSSNHLPTVPEEVGALYNLAHLKLYDNLLTSLPDELGQLTNLQSLWIYDNSLVSIPKEICDLPLSGYPTMIFHDDGLVCTE